MGLFEWEKDVAIEFKSRTSSIEIAMTSSNEVDQIMSVKKLRKGIN